MLHPTFLTLTGIDKELHGRMLHSRVSFIILHRALLLVTREEMPIPQLREHSDQEVVWTTQWTPNLSQARRDDREEGRVRKNDGEHYKIWRAKEGEAGSAKVKVEEKWPSGWEGKADVRGWRHTSLIHWTGNTDTEGDYIEGRTAWQRCVLCERERAHLVCKESVENKPHTNANTPAQMLRKRPTLRLFVRQGAKMAKT